MSKTGLFKESRPELSNISATQQGAAETHSCRQATTYRLRFEHGITDGGGIASQHTEHAPRQPSTLSEVSQRKCCRQDMGLGWACEQRWACGWALSEGGDMSE